MKRRAFEAKMRALEHYHSLRLLPGAWVMLRVDGRSFSRFPAERFEKPFDDRSGDAPALCRGASRSSLQPGRLALEDATSRDERNDPRDKPVAFLARRAFRVETSVRHHGTRPWHLACLQGLRWLFVLALLLALARPVA